ncbi:class I SAM-dependent methyltransferase [Sphingosinicella sp. LHD-64]|uniref:class I SAM-dependent methyltransferase n=1 Tax=Sphingosinicella sp. LHD-64 TaxID=3072139 RepID=UPI00280D3736|nr:class I SAM-dependent methyltransferase [Sphingosinicella sp. LHD-64]MDQ8756158.1 class I SAM-dependent methyltransferase [Sphingosinicella sp. LHD-64]
MSAFLAHFSDPDAVARYAEGPPRYVPGLADLHRMTAILLGERAPADARVLVLGAGGGLELRALAEARPGWTFDGVDPAAEMLKLAERTLGPMAPRATLHEGYIDCAPDGPFDAAVCLLTLHFLGREERLRTEREIRQRLRPRAPFVMAHSSFPQDPAERDVWLSRYAAFAIASGADPDQARGARTAVAAHLNLLDPEEDEAVLRDAGFTGVRLFYAAFTWRGWIACA